MRCVQLRKKLHPKAYGWMPDDARGKVEVLLSLAIPVHVAPLPRLVRAP
jgi:hypothetical protein